MHNPPHPGAVLKTLCLEPLELSVTAAAKARGVSRKTLSAIINGRAGDTYPPCGGFGSGGARAWGGYMSPAAGHESGLAVGPAGQLSADGQLTHSDFGGGVDGVGKGGASHGAAILWDGTGPPPTTPAAGQLPGFALGKKSIL